MVETQFGTFDDLMALAGSDMQPIARRLRELILGVDPDSVEVVRLGDRAATYGVGPKKMSEGYAYIMPQKNWVNLGFYQGAVLPDPEQLLEGTGARLRHVKIRSIADAGQTAVRDLLVAALAERRTSLGL